MSMSAWMNDDQVNKTKIFDCAIIEVNGCTRAVIRSIDAQQERVGELMKAEIYGLNAK